MRRLGISDEELAKLINANAQVDAAIDRFMRDVLVPAWKNHPDTPVDSGDYAASVKIVKKARRGKGAVAATDFKAHWIEFGTGQPGPTKAYGIAEKVARKFGGTLDAGVDLKGESQ